MTTTFLDEALRAAGERAPLLHSIYDAFHASEPPGHPPNFFDYTDDIKSPNYAEAIEETARFWGKDWSELSLEDFDACQFVFSFLTPESEPYFLGALMFFSVRDMSFDHFAIDDVFPRRGAPLRGKKRRRASAFSRMSLFWRIRTVWTPLQRRVTINYLDFLAHSTRFRPEELSDARGFLSGEVDP